MLYDLGMSCDVGTDVPHAAALLAAGRLVAFPTETVYGLGAHALDTVAVAKVFEAKGRPHFDPLIVHVADLDQAERLCRSFPLRAEELAARFWPGPLTLVLPKSNIVPDLVTAGLPNVAVRVPSHPVARSLIRQVGLPIAAPSANRFGQISPTSAAHVASQLEDRIDYILEGGECDVGIESTVLHLATECPTLLRPGGVTQEDLEAVIGPIAVMAGVAGRENEPQASPGLLGRHYAPRTPLRILEQIPTHEFSNSVGLLSFGPVGAAGQFAAVEVLSPTLDLAEAAAGFYAALRRLDASGADAIIARPFPETGLGRALNDRLRRAAIQEQ
jgi:L-threonylcarbamoyladenylate synthase